MIKRAKKEKRGFRDYKTTKFTYEGKNSWPLKLDAQQQQQQQQQQQRNENETNQALNFRSLRQCWAEN